LLTWRQICVARAPAHAGSLNSLPAGSECSVGLVTRSHSIYSAMETWSHVFVGGGARRTARMGRDCIANVLKVRYHVVLFYLAYFGETILPSSHWWTTASIVNVKCC
jgi:elongation factor P hydroxylase